MGNRAHYLTDGGFSTFEYKTIRHIQHENISGKVVAPIKYVDNPSLPLYANTGIIYFLQDPRQNNEITQMRLYINRMAAFDFDWGHSHGEFAKGEVHVHQWHNENGKIIARSKGKYKARAMTQEEILLYGKLILTANPKAILCKK